MKRDTRRYSLIVLSCAALMSLSGCKTTETPVAGPMIDSLAGMHDDTEKRLSTAAADAISEGRTEEALALYERLYKNSTMDYSGPHGKPEDIALNYAQLLRKTGKPQDAIDALAPFLRTGRARRSASPIVLNEYAASSIELGNFEQAEKSLHQVLENEKAAEFHADARNLMGVIMGARGQYREAEKSFRQALKGWKGESTSVLNNLGLCLASQGLFDESLLTLRQALVGARHKENVARNIRMVEDLRKAIVPAPPEAAKK